MTARRTAANSTTRRRAGRKGKGKGKATAQPATTRPRPRTARRPSSRSERARAAGLAHCPVVGIGASAGGLEALQELLTHVGTDTGMAFVVVQHLSPTHESLLSDILSRATTMPVSQATHGMLVQPNHVYVIPPNRDIRLEQGMLKLGRRARGLHRFLPVDHFFRSLAGDCGGAAIGIVLSGSSSDGMEGLRSIKSAGGITFAQDEKSAQYPEMPRSAVSSGAVDLVMSPPDIARELGRLRGQAFVLRTDAGHGPGTEDGPIEEVLQVLHAVTGADFAYYKPNTIRRRIFRRMALARIDRLPAYVVLLKERREEVEELYEDLLINVTSFFRDPATFRAFQRKVLPLLFKGRCKDARVRIWVPGCSTGEEVYSIAMCVFDHLGERASSRQVQVFGTDLSESVVERARQGRYPATIASDVSPERLQRYFTPTADGFQVRKSLCEACVFAKHNLLKDPPFSKMDVVSCRNVLIYFGSVLQKKAIALFHYALRPDGFLMLGNAEHVASFGELFTMLDRQHKLYVKKPVPSRLTFLGEGGAGEDGQPSPAEPASAAGLRQTDTRALEIQREADRIVASRYFPAGVVVDDDLDILQFRGNTAPFLQARPGTASLNLMKMAREGLLFELRSAFQRARKERVPSRRTGIRMRSDDGGLIDVTLEVVPFMPRQSRVRLFLVMFEITKPPSEVAARPGGPRASAKSGRARSTEQELAATKDYLQTIVEEQEATNEELMSANEEILSSNEELQSTNEELETAKEELQSANEELSTVNDEVQERNADLNALNNDLTNLLATIHIPMVILDAELRVRRATPLGEKLLNLIPADVGRRVTDVRTRVELPDLPALVRDVMENATTKDFDVRDDQGRWYAMRVRPYMTSARKIDGVVITWLDSESARQQARTAVRGLAHAMLTAMPRPAALLSADLRVETSNGPWSARFGASPQDGPLAWDDAKLTSALRETLLSGRPLASHPLEVALPRGRVAVSISAARVPTDQDDVSLLFVVAAEADGAPRPS